MAKGHDLDYKNMFKSLPIPALVLLPNPPGYTIIEVNEAFTSIVPFPLEELYNKSVTDFFPGNFSNPDDNASRLMHSLRIVTTKKIPHNMGILVLDENHPINHKKKTVYYDLMNIPILNDDGDVAFIIHTVSDVTTEQVQAIKIKKDEKRFRALVEHGSDILWVIGKEGNPIYSSPSVERILGYTVDEILTMDATELLHPDDVNHVYNEIGLAMETPGKTITVTPARMKHKNGSWRWFGGTITNMLNDPAIGGIVDNFRDITDQVEAEIKLREAKNKFQSIIHTIDGIFWEAERDGIKFTFVSPQSKDILGHTPKEWIQTTNFWADHIHPEDREEALFYCREQTRAGKNHTFEYRFRKADGSYLWVRDVVSVIREKNGASVLQGFILDISSQKKLESQLERAYEIARIGNWEIDIKTKKVYWSRFLKELHEVEPSFEPSLDSVINFFEKGVNRQKISLRIKNSIQNNTPFDDEFKIITAKNNERWVRVVGEAEFRNGTCEKIFGSTQDITNQKLAQIKLKETEEKFRNVVEHSTNMFYTHDRDGNLTYVSPQSVHFLGQAPEESDQQWTDFVTDHPANEIGHYFTNKAIETGETQPSYELQLKREDGTFIWVEVNEAPMVKNGKVTAIVGSLTDVTDRKNYEDQLRESLDRYDLVTKATSDAIYDWDILNDHLDWGDGYHVLFGYPAHQPNYPLSKWSSHIHPDDIKETLESLNYILHQTSKTGWSHEYRFQRKNGEYADVLEDGFIIRNNSDEPIRMVGAVRDISDQKKQEKLLEESVREKETLLAEIHHRVKNNLAVISSLMELQAINSDNEELNERLLESVLRIKSIAEIHERLYQSSSFASIQFSESLTSLVKDIVHTLRIDTDISLSFQVNPVELNIKQSVPCSLLINEVITNVIKHGFKGQKNGRMDIFLSLKEDDVFIKIVDNGVGLPNNLHDKKTASMGLKLIEVLTSQINGKTTHRTDNGKTTFTLVFPRDKTEQY